MVWLFVIITTFTNSFIMGPSFEKIMLYSLTLVTLAGVAGLTYSKKHVQTICVFYDEIGWFTTN